LELTADLARRGVLVSIGHTDADFETLDRAVAAGARHMTHFCNAMRPLHHREPGPIGFGLSRRDVTIDLIADFHHVHARMIELVLAARGGEGVALISDAMPAAGLPDGEYEAWGEVLSVRDGQARNARGSLAGSVALLDSCVANARALFGEEEARAAATKVPLAILHGARPPSRKA
jgi:N-acetylglucosamine-6-phosphate deacetylase